LDHEGSAFHREAHDKCAPTAENWNGSTKDAPGQGAFPHKKKAAPAMSRDGLS